jgi:hypothetical protein
MANQAGIIASKSGALMKKTRARRLNRISHLFAFMIQPLLNRFMTEFHQMKFCALEQCREILVLTLCWKVSLNHFQE